VALILKTFTFEPYRYPYKPLGRPLSFDFLRYIFALFNILTRRCRRFMSCGCYFQRIRQSFFKDESTRPDNYSNRKICTGRIFAAERAGSTVAAMLIARAAAAIHNASNPLA
jgi:hypothetical protein